MPITRPIPKEAKKVLRILRRDVKRPRLYPKISSCWSGASLRWAGDVCPMGLHPQSTSKIPTTGQSFDGGKCSTAEVKAFYMWWDSQEDARAAVDAVWPKKGK